jgi:hypothetical protein
MQLNNFIGVALIAVATMDVAVTALSASSSNPQACPFAFCPSKPKN